MVLDAWPSDSLGNVKDAVCQSLMIDPNQTMLVYNGKPLDDHMTVAQMALGDGSRLQLMLRYPGG